MKNKKKITVTEDNKLKIFRIISFSLICSSLYMTFIQSFLFFVYMIIDYGNNFANFSAFMLSFVLLIYTIYLSVEKFKSRYKAAYNKAKDVAYIESMDIFNIYKVITTEGVICFILSVLMTLLYNNILLKFHENQLIFTIFSINVYISNFLVVMHIIFSISYIIFLVASRWPIIKLIKTKHII